MYDCGAVPRGAVRCRRLTRANCATLAATEMCIEMIDFAISGHVRGLARVAEAGDSLF